MLSILAGIVSGVAVSIQRTLDEAATTAAAYTSDEAIEAAEELAAEIRKMNDRAG
jgi:hypothetical protein